RNSSLASVVKRRSSACTSWARKRIHVVHRQIIEALKAIARPTTPPSNAVSNVSFWSVFAHRISQMAHCPDQRLSRALVDFFAEPTDVNFDQLCVVLVRSFPNTLAQFRPTRRILPVGATTRRPTALTRARSSFIANGLVT